MSDARAHLALQQQRLLRALLHDGAFQGVAADRLGALQAVVRQKRQALVARCAPALASWLGADLAPLFEGYAQNHGLPSEGPVRDALQFGATLSAVPDWVREELLALSVRERRRRGGWPVGVGWLRTSGRLVVVVGGTWLRLRVTSPSSSPRGRP